PHNTNNSHTFNVFPLWFTWTIRLVTIHFIQGRIVLPITKVGYHHAQDATHCNILPMMPIIIQSTHSNQSSNSEWSERNVQLVRITLSVKQLQFTCHVKCK